jgi:DNA-directed RNA polymerase specialized sigma subunit
VEREDVNRAAEFGLLQAAHAYDSSRGISFATFPYRVKGTIYDHLRSSWRAAEFNEAANELMRDYSESPPAARRRRRRMKKSRT